MNRNIFDKSVLDYLRESTGYNIVYRGGLPLDANKTKSDGVSFTKSIDIAQYWAGSNVNGRVFKYMIKEDSNILTPENFSEKITPREKPYNHQDKERIVNHALVEGYDGVDLSKHFNEEEIRIFNIDVLTSILD